MLSMHHDEADAGSAAFDDVIESTVADMIEALKDNHKHVRQAAMDTIGKLARCGGC
jgi:hypothetical protein